MLEHQGQSIKRKPPCVRYSPNWREQICCHLVITNWKSKPVYKGSVLQKQLKGSFRWLCILLRNSKINNIFNFGKVSSYYPSSNFLLSSEGPLQYSYFVFTPLCKITLSSWASPTLHLYPLYSHFSGRFRKKNSANVNAPLLTVSKEAYDGNGVVLLVVNVTPCYLLEDEVSMS